MLGQSASVLSLLRLNRMVSNMISAVAGTSWQRLPTSFHPQIHNVPMIDTSPFPSSFCRQVLNLLRQIYDAIQRLSFDGSSAPRIYDNKAAMALLGIKDKYLKNLRDNGYLGYSRHGDKYWYTQADIDRFLSRFHYDPFTDKY